MTGRDAIFAAVKERYQTRDLAFGKPRFSEFDWARTRIAFDLLEGMRSVVDVGIGQGQLVNLFVDYPETERVCGVDFPPALEAHRAGERPLLLPAVGCDQTAGPAAAAGRRRGGDGDLRACRCRQGRRRAGAHPQALAQRNGPGHGALSGTRASLPPRPAARAQQSFDDARIEAVFGPRALVSSYTEKWYLVMLSDHVECHRTLALELFREACRSVVRRAVTAL